MKIRNLLHRATISIVLTLFLAYFLLKQIRFESIFSLFGSINYSYLLLSFALSLLIVLARALRVKILLNGRKADIKILFALVLENNFLVNILPFRTGDLTFPLLINKYASISKKEGLLMLFYLRILDMCTILLFLLAAALLFSNDVLYFTPALLLIVALMIFFVAMFFFKAERILLLSIHFLHNKNKLKYADVLENNLNKILAVYGFYRKTAFSIIFLSLVTFIVMILAMGAALEAYPINLSYLNVIFFSLMIITITSLPINGIAGIGTVELGIAAFLTSAGVDKDLSISIAFNYHFITLMIMMICAGLGHLYLSIRAREI